MYGNSALNFGQSNSQCISGTAGAETRLGGLYIRLLAVIQIDTRK